jgi:hypothetical protein
MNSLTIQILVLVASFLFYRILRSGFDSWQAVAIDFGVVLFLFVLQYFLQSKQKEFPAGHLSRFYGAVFPDKISMEDEKTEIKHTSDKSQRLLISAAPQEHIYLEPNQKQILKLKNSIARKDSIASWDGEIKQSGLYLFQASILTDQLPYHAKLSVIGEHNMMDKPVHHGENSFILSLNGPDKIRLEIENGKQKAMILDQSSFYIVQL